MATWQGEFGNAYTDRNVIDWRARMPAFKKSLDGLELERVLEVGCNRGHNLQALSEILRDSSEIFGVEPNAHALAIARGASDKISAVPGTIYDLPFKDGFFDLVFTVGVLIHIPTDRLPAALQEIWRVSRRYILAAEYYAPSDTAIEYRGRNDLLWKRDFLKHYESTVPGLKPVRSGFWNLEDGFDRTHWWLLEKTCSPII
ncbi:MAG: pseudaminic acid biosynthesis-associated methylase [Silvibacterium sp.]